MFLNWDWPAAEAAFERAIELNPNHAHTYLEYGHLLALVGRYDEAKERFEEAIRLNPVSSAHVSGLGMLYAGFGRLNEAESMLQEAFELNKDNEDAFVWLADVRQKQGRFDDAVEIMERAVFSREHPELALRCFLGNAYAMAGRMEDARGQLAEMHKMKSEVPGHHIWFGELHAALGEKDEAFRWLDQALAEREAWLPHHSTGSGVSPHPKRPPLRGIASQDGTGPCRPVVFHRRTVTRGTSGKAAMIRWSTMAREWPAAAAGRGSNGKCRLKGGFDVVSRVQRGF